MMQRVQRLFAACLLGVLVAALVAACGSHTHSGASVTVTTASGGKTTTTVESLKQACPPGGGYMGCALGAPKSSTTTPTLTYPAPQGVRFPDVSSYQGCAIDWSSVGVPGAVFKLGESDDIVDACASHNYTGLRAARKVAIGYWFMRPVGLSAQEQYVVKTLKSLDFTVDHVVEYTSPGTYSGGGGLRLSWVAAYTGGQHPPELPYSTSEKAWQYSDDASFTGLDGVDASVTYGLLGLGAHTLVLDTEVPGLAGYDQATAAYVLKHDPVPKSKLITCEPFRAQKTISDCSALKRNERHFESEIAAQRALLRSHHCYAHRTRGACIAELKRGDQEHVALNRLLSTSHVQP